MTASFFFFFYGQFSSFNFRYIFCIESVHPCVNVLVYTCTCVQIDNASMSVAITINLSCNFCKTDVVVSIFSLSLFFFCADDGVQLCEGVRVHSSCRFLGDAPPLGFFNVRTFFKNGSIKSLEGILCRITLIDTQYHLVAATLFFFFQLLITQHQCSYIHIMHL